MLTFNPPTITDWLMNLIQSPSPIRLFLVCFFCRNDKIYSEIKRICNGQTTTVFSYYITNTL